MFWSYFILCYVDIRYTCGEQCRCVTFLLCFTTHCLREARTHTRTHTHLHFLSHSLASFGSCLSWACCYLSGTVLPSGIYTTIFLSVLILVLDVSHVPIWGTLWHVPSQAQRFLAWWWLFPPLIWGFVIGVDGFRLPLPYLFCRGLVAGAQFCPLYRLAPFHLGTNCWSLTRRCLCLGRFLWLVADGLTTLETPFSSVERRLSGWYPFGLLLWAAVVVFPLLLSALRFVYASALRLIPLPWWGFPWLSDGHFLCLRLIFSDCSFWWLPLGST